MSAAVKPDATTTSLDPRDRGGPAQPLLAVTGLRKHFPVYGGLLNRRVATVQAVDDVNFTVAKGETVGVVGESGCGKSTTARLLMHLMLPDAGSIVFDGEEVGAPRAAKEGEGGNQGRRGLGRDRDHESAAAGQLLAVALADDGAGGALAG